MSKNNESTMKWKLDIADLKAGIQQANRSIQQANSEYKAATASMDSWGKSADGLAAKHRQLHTVFDLEKQKLDILRDQYKLVAENQGENSKEAQNLAIKMNGQEASVGRTEKALRELDRQLIEAKKNGSLASDEFEEMASREAQLILKTDETKRSLAELKEVSGELGARISHDLVNAIKAGTVALASLIAYSAKVGMDFEAGMSEVGAISGATGEELVKLTEKAKEMGIKTKFSASEAADALKYMAMAGWKTSDMLDGLEGIMNLAAASGEELGAVADIVTDDMTAFGLSAKDSGHFADVLAMASAAANTNVSLMGESFKECGALAGTMGYSIEDMSLAVGTMANSGIKGSKAGTALKNAIANMAKPTDAMAGVMDEFNLSLSNADGTMKPFKQVIDELRTSFSGLSKDQQAANAATLFGKEAMAGMLSVINANESDYRKLDDAIRHADGSSQKMADTMIDNAKGAFTIMGSTAEGVGLKIYDVFGDDLKNSIKTATGEIENFGDELSKPRVKESLKTVANGFFDLTNTVIKLAKNAIPPFLNGMSFVISNGKVLMPIITGVGTAVYLYHTKTVLAAKATKDLSTAQLVVKAGAAAYHTVMGILNGTIDAQIAKTAVLNALQTATPWGIAALGIAGVVGGLTMLISATNNSNKEHREMMESIQAEIDKREELKEQQNEQMQSNLSEIENTSMLNEELKTLVDENGNVKEGYEIRASYIMNELNEALGTEMRMNGNVIEGYKDLREQIDLLLMKKKAEIILEAQLPMYKKAVTESTKEQMKANQLNSELTSMNNAKKEQEFLLEQRYGKEWKNEIAMRPEILKSSLYTQWKWLDQNTKDKQTEYDKQKTVLQGYYDDINSYDVNSMRLQSSNAEEIAKIQTDMTIKKSDSSTKQKETLQAQIDFEKSSLETLKVNYSETNDALIKGQIESKEKHIRTMEEQMTGLVSTVEVNKEPMGLKFTEFAVNAVNSFFTVDFKGAGRKSTQNVIDGSSSWDLSEGLWVAGENSGKTMKSGAESVDFVPVGENYNKGLKKGTLFESLYNFGFAVAEMLKTGTKDGLDEHSPSREGAKIGDFYVQGIALGITDNAKKLKDAAFNAGRILVDETKKMAEDTGAVLNTGSMNISASTLNRIRSTESITGASEVKAGSVINFNQNNYSPKALGRLEIYRNTNSLLIRAGRKLKNV